MCHFNKYILQLFIAVGVLCLFSCGEKKTADKKEQQITDTNPGTKSQWQTVFNGKNLEGFTMKIKGYPLGENFGNTFRVEDKILKVRYDGYGPDLDGRFGTLYIDKELTDYRLKVEYRFVGETAAGAPEWGYRDSGIQFHGQPPATQQIDQAFPLCLEYNFHGGNGTDERPTGAACGYGISFEVESKKNATTCVPATVSKTIHGDQWITAELDIKDGKISHFLNGEEILSYSNPQYDATHDRAKNYNLPADPEVKSGYVSFQSNSHPIDFRKIELLAYK